MQLENIFAWIVIGNCLLIVVLFGLYLKSKVRLSELSAETEKLEQQTILFKRHLMQIEEAMNEIRTGARGMGNEINSLKGGLESITSQIEEISVQQEALANAEPESRLYSKASKMAAQGASVEELMKDCELPKAAAELLLSLHHKSSS